LLPVVYDVREVNSIDVAKSTVEVNVPGRTQNEVIPLTKCFAMNPKHMSDLCGLHNIHEAGAFGDTRVAVCMYMYLWRVALQMLLM
jgi:hypothetical protein